jgi:hypothetical protein
LSPSHSNVRLVKPERADTSAMLFPESHSDVRLVKEC